MENKYIYEQQENIENNPIVVDATKKEEPSMVFHLIYTILLLFSGGSTLSSCIISTFYYIYQEEYWLILFMIPAFFSGAYLLITGLLLYKRKRAGNVMRIIHCICTLVSNTFLFFAGGICIVLLLYFKDSFASHEMYLLFSTFGIVISIFLIIGALLSIAFHIIVMVYYKKRKHMFN